MKSLLHRLSALGQVSALDVHFATSMGRIAGEEEPAVLVAAALLSQQVARGHVCLDMAGATQESLGLRGEEMALPDADEWLKILQGSSMVSEGGSASSEKTPLVLDASGRLYLHRYWNHEQVLAEQILARASAPAPGVDDAVLAEGLDRLFPPAEEGEFDFQRFAALMAVRRLFCVVSGGPGTGKTHTVVNILALLVEQAFAAGLPAPHMTLVAPTGKAASRLTESIKKSKAELSCSDEVREAIVESAATIHRCLRPMGPSSIDFRHNALNPLVTNLVLVDEASMVNLGLMRRLVSAMPSHARLILLGDMDQLASVEAGAVLGDICQSGHKRVYSHSLRDEVKELGGGELPEDMSSKVAPPLADCIAKLVKSYRFRGETGIAALAAAIKRGDSREATDILERFDDVEIVAPSKAGKLSASLRAALVAGYGPYLEAGQSADRLAAFDRFRVLCARRTGPFGVGSLNEQIESVLARAGLIERGADNYEGRPIMVSANTYELQLYNGDIGLVLPDPETGNLRACFTGSGGALRMFAPFRLPHQETALAMSVHKSQGSEFDEVAIVLPDEASPLLTRELIYTAITRARTKVVIHGHAEVLRHAIEHPTQRNSGLRPALWGEAGAAVRDPE